MSTKKQILKKMALIGVGVFVVSALAFAAVEWLRDESREQHRTETRERREEAIRKYRDYLTETSKKIVRTPVDPNIVGQAQTRYFEEAPNARLYLWAVDDRGQFLFGVPSEAFAKLNRAYDKFQKTIEQEGRFVDRQDFLRRLVQDHKDLDFEEFEALTGEQSEARNRGWRPWNEHDEDGLVFSRPFVSEQGALLGNLYLKVTGVESGYEHWNEYEGPSVVSGTLTFGSLIFLWFLLPTWVYLDATARNMPSPVRWAALTLVGLVFGLAAYLIVRPEESAGRVCPGCSRDVGSARFCPHCGSPVSSEFCQGCGYPVRPDWSFCPNCQAPNRIEEPSESVGPTTPGTLPPEAEV